MSSAHSMAQRRRAARRCDAIPLGPSSRSPRPADRSVRPAKEFLHRVFRRDGIHRQAGSQLQAGDLVFFNGLGHMGIYMGGGQFVHAPHTGDVVKISSLAGRNPVGAVRPG